MDIAHQLRVIPPPVPVLGISDSDLRISLLRTRGLDPLLCVDFRLNFPFLFRALLGPPTWRFVFSDILSFVGFLYTHMTVQPANKLTTHMLRVFDTCLLHKSRASGTCEAVMSNKIVS